MTKRPSGPAPRDLFVTTLRIAGREYAIVSFPIAPDDLPSSLGEVEKQVLAAILEGKSNAEIARQRGTSRYTVANQVASVYRKLGLSSRAEVVARFARTQPSSGPREPEAAPVERGQRRRRLGGKGSRHRE